MKKLSFGEVYDQFDEGQTIDRAKFIAECKRILDPVEAQADLDQILRLKASGRSLKAEVDDAVHT